MIKMGFLEHFQQNNQTLENIFQSIFWNATKHLKIFPFPENNISGKYFTWTKRSLIYNPLAVTDILSVRLGSAFCASQTHILRFFQKKKNFKPVLGVLFMGHEQCTKAYEQ